MTITIVTPPDRKTVTALCRAPVEPRRLTRCLERAASAFAGARVVGAQCTGVPFDRDAWAFSVCGELRLPAPASPAGLRRVAMALAHELRADGFAIE